MDQLVTLDGNVPFYPEECCWVGTTKIKEEVREILEFEVECSAVGGPIGVFRRKGDLCKKPFGQYVFERESRFVIEQGLFKSSNTSFHDRNERDDDKALTSAATNRHSAP
ncbi:hypothetical protein [Reinekea sp. G2M2-21]|uniref:hypothetical protein n=1 Tax=Reinekea sp. G2M2-21 TaxID=2788942 RepID=UPI0018AAD45F|nr:hypothetical protein [Reinekea sp. G2M2-21]